MDVSIIETSGLGDRTWAINPRSERDLTVLDVRQSDEYTGGHLRGALNIPLHELRSRIEELPGGEVWVHCASGYRSSIAASMIYQADRTVVLVNDEFDTVPEGELLR